MSDINEQIARRLERHDAGLLDVYHAAQCDVNWPPVADLLRAAADEISRLCGDRDALATALRELHDFAVTDPHYRHGDRSMLSLIHI